LYCFCFSSFLLPFVFVNTWCLYLLSECLLIFLNYIEYNNIDTEIKFLYRHWPDMLDGK
jgi:hypothetical protein